MCCDGTILRQGESVVKSLRMKHAGSLLAEVQSPAVHSQMCPEISTPLPLSLLPGKVLEGQASTSHFSSPPQIQTLP